MSTRAKHPGPEEHGPGATKNLQELHDDDAIVVPKGTSKLRFLFLLFLTIFILVIFTVGDELMSSFGRKATNQDLVSWDGPIVGKRVLTAVEFMDEKRREDDYRRVVNDRTQTDDDRLATELLLDELAKQSGVEIPIKELSKEVFEGTSGLSMAFQNQQLYKLVLQNNGVPGRVFEGVLRRKLRINRYLSLLSSMSPRPDNQAIEAHWKSMHPQVAFDLVGVDHASFDAEARAQMPDAAGLKAWYDELPDKQQLFFADFLPETNAAELIAYRVAGENPATALLERFPLAADRDQEQLAKDYYNQYSSVRFVRATPLPEGSPEAEGKDRLLNSYEEVAELAKQESMILEAFRAWVSDVKARKQAGTPIDLAMEATTFGLSYRPVDAAKTEAEWSALPDYGGPFIARSIMGTQKDDFAADVAVDRNGFSFARVTEKIPASPPPFEKVADKAQTEWLKQKTQELATAKLNAIRDTFPKPEETAPTKNPKADEAAFKAAAEAAGMTVERRDWMSFSEQGSDPEASKPSHDFLRTSGFLRNLPADEVAPVQPDRTRMHSYLVRSLGTREPPVVKLTPGDLDQYMKKLQRDNDEAFFKTNFSPAALGERFKLRVKGSKEIPEPGT
ncbi:MAG TPA: hypothetical protein VK843_05425 [Planctomycetota bacterium]|nr:hypothetical protein [Planctomycetota bacterium]